MKICITILTSGLLAACEMWNAHAQGLIEFTTRSAVGVDAAVTFIDGTPVGPTFNAQLYGGPAQAAVADLTPLSPATVFRSGSSAAQKYIVPVVVSVPGVLPGEIGKFFMRAFNGPTWETSTYRGESQPFGDLVGGGDFIPPTRDVSAFTVGAVPEPSTLALWAIAGIVLVVRRRLGAP